MKEKTKHELEVRCVSILVGIILWFYLTYFSKGVVIFG